MTNIGKPEMLEANDYATITSGINKRSCFIKIDGYNL